MICEKRGYGGTKIDNTPGIVTCLRDECGHVKFIGGVVVDRPRLRKLAGRKEELREGKKSVKGEVS